MYNVNEIYQFNHREKCKKNLLERADDSQENEMVWVSNGMDQSEGVYKSLSKANICKIFLFKF
jgi:hypothetical protein